jgi:hypothetical protein
MTRAFVVLLYVLAIALMPACAADPKPVAPDYEARRLGSEETVPLASLELEESKLSLSAQAELLSLSRSGLYYNTDTADS